MKHYLPFIFSLLVIQFISSGTCGQQYTVDVGFAKSAKYDSVQADTTKTVTSKPVPMDTTKAGQELLITSDSSNAASNSTVLGTTQKTRAKRIRTKKPDSLKIKINSGLQFYLDYGKIGTLVSEFEQKFEFGIGYQFSFRLQPNFQYGIGTIEPEQAIENGEYRSEGSYWRVGLNYMIPLDNTNSLFIGIKYAQSQFDDSGSYEITSDLWPTFRDEFSRSGFSADWYSFILGSEKKLMDGKLILGGQTGVRILNSRDEEDFIDVYTIPGYGLTSGDSNPFLNLYIKYHLGF